jgi:branched-chain amino acid transport system ATP-binding protein
MLTVENLHVAYGDHDILHGVSLEVGHGQFVAVVGPNGAGKTTLFRTISGTVPAKSGEITFNGRDLTALAADSRAHLGIAHVPEGRQVFPSLSVEENLEMGAFPPVAQTHWRENEEKIYSWFPRLAERRTQLAGTLSGGEQQMLAIGRGLASSPELLMLDEPSMGLAPAIADEIFERIVTIREAQHLSILLVEQRVAEALHFADRGYVLETGRVILDGDRETLSNEDRIRQAYLGM